MAAEILRIEIDDAAANDERVCIVIDMSKTTAIAAGSFAILLGLMIAVNQVFSALRILHVI